MAGADTTVATDPANTQKRAFPTLNSLGWIDLVVAMNVSLAGQTLTLGVWPARLYEYYYTLWTPLQISYDTPVGASWPLPANWLLCRAIYGLSTSLENPWYIAVLLQSKVEKILVEPRYRVR